MFQNLTGWHFVILLVIILLLFGAPRLPALARSLGQSFRILKGEVKSAKDDDATGADGTAANAAAPTSASATEATRPAPEAPPSNGGVTGEPGDTAPRQ